jgi:hypothetical protein
MGEKAGHPFRGNQFTAAKSGSSYYGKTSFQAQTGIPGKTVTVSAGGAQGRGTPERLARAKQLRTVRGASTEVLKAALDSNSGDSSFRYDLSRELHKRSKREPVIDHKFIADQAVKAVQGGAKPEHVQVMVDTLKKTDKHQEWLKSMKEEKHAAAVKRAKEFANRPDVLRAERKEQAREERIAKFNRESAARERKNALKQGGRVTIVGQVRGQGKGGFISEVSPSGSFFGVEGHKSGKFLGYYHESNLKPKSSSGGGGRRVPKHVKERFRGVFNPERKK